MHTNSEDTQEVFRLLVELGELDPIRAEGWANVQLPSEESGDYLLREGISLMETKPMSFFNQLLLARAHEREPYDPSIVRYIVRQAHTLGEGINEWPAILDLVVWSKANTLFMAVEECFVEESCNCHGKTSLAYAKRHRCA